MERIQIKILQGCQETQRWLKNSVVLNKPTSQPISELVHDTIRELRNLISALISLDGPSFF